MRLAWRAAGMHRLRALLLALLPAFLCGCSLNPPLELADVSSPRTQTRLLAVPFFAQDEYQCGPAALAGVLGASGTSAMPEALTPQVYLPGRRGSLQLELLAATRRAGRLPYVLAGEPRALLAELEAGRPVLVLQNLRTRHYPVWHYAVLTGFDATRNQLYLNSGSEQDLALAAPAFLRTWDWAGRWAMVALRPGELPASAEAAAYLDAALAFERVAAPDAAQQAWQAAATVWPAQALPHLALGNLAYRAQDLERAAAHYRGGLAHNAGDPALANNLASVLGELGCPRRAESLLRQVADALAADSRWKTATATTLRELGARTGPDDLSCNAPPSP